MRELKYKKLQYFRLLVFCFIPCVLFLFSFIGFSSPKRPGFSAKYKLDFFTSQNQFYLADSGYVSNTGAPEYWTNEAYADRLANADDVIGISIASFGHVKAELNVMDAPDTEKDFSKYDHVVEAGVKLNTGLLEVFDYPDTKIQLKAIVTPGRYRIRVYSYSLKNVNPEEDEGTDHYKITLWRNDNMQRKVLKRFVKE